MRSFRTFIHPLSIYIFLYFLALIICLIPQLFFSQEMIFLEINRHNSSLADIFFKTATLFGDGLAFVLLILGLSFYSYSKMLSGVAVFLSTSIVAQFLKRVIFSDRYRPFKVLGDQYDLYVPNGVETITMNSFPSGHTVTAFAMATFLAFILSSRKSYGLMLLLFAIITAYSRVYLTHHFVIDVWVGSLIGVLGAILVYWWTDQYFDRKFGSKSLLNR